ncbi:MAG: hypothetical protein C0390_02085 [Syntrophus sp. (in: bacteria)]|nr:hypothetical protein [Syntrophus sp. (in: bacteria)]
MTTMTDTILIILSAAFLLLVGFSIPFFLQLWRVAKGMAITLRTLNQNLPGIMKNVEEITTNVNRTTTTVHRQVEDLSLTLQKIQGTLNLIIGVEEIFRRSVHLSFAKNLKTSVAVAKGVRVFLDHLISKRT